MRILMISAPYKPTPPTGYAGIERIVFWYVRELVKRGHEVTTICVPGSTVPGKQIIWEGGEGLPEHAHIREPEFEGWFRHRISGQTRADGSWEHRFMGMNESDVFRFDLVHDHTHLKYPAMYCDALGIPFLNGVHLPNPPFTKNAIALSRAHRKVVCPSAKIIHLGVPADDYPFCGRKEDYALYLGVMAEYKGVHLAIKAAKELDIRLILAGPETFFPGYFHKMIEPELDDKRTWVGEVGGGYKLELLGKARFIVLPIMWEEPGSTVCFEALACGTPVIGFNRGALKDIVTPRIGTLAETYRGLVKAMERPPINYEACRKYVVENFDIPSRVEAYEQLYEKVLAGETW